MSVEQHHQTDVDQLLRDLFGAGPVEHEFCPGLLVDLFSRSHDSLSQCPSVLDLNPPLLICGDIHGQYADLLNIFMKCGWPFNTRYLFLGDYVDRGSHSLEVLVLLTALQLRFPNNVYLLRGNHETPSVTKTYGFLSELRARYRKKADCDRVWDQVGRVFSQLPIAAVVRENILCLHGGLSPKLKSIQDLRDIKRGVLEPDGLTEDLLWADPSPDCLGFKDNKARGCSYTFGDDVIGQQLKQLGVNMIIRGHQLADNGYRFSNKNKVLTLFSAPSYSDDYHNRAAVFQISRQGEASFIFLNASKMRRVGKTATVLRSTH